MKERGKHEVTESGIDDGDSWVAVVVVSVVEVRI